MRLRSTKYLENLQVLALFRGLGQRELSSLAGLVTPVDIAAGQSLTVQGAPGRQAFISSPDKPRSPLTDDLSP